MGRCEVRRGKQGREDVRRDPGWLRPVHTGGPAGGPNTLLARLYTPGPVPCPCLQEGLTHF